MKNFVVFSCLSLFSVQAFAFDEGNMLDFNADTRLLNIEVYKQPVHEVLAQIADFAGFEVEADFKKLSVTQKKISVNLTQVTPEKAVALILGNMNRITTYSTADNQKPRLERIQILASTGTQVNDRKNRLGTVNVQSKEIVNKSRTVIPEQHAKPDLLLRFKQRYAEKKKAKHNQLKLSEQKLLSHLDDIQKNLIDEYTNIDDDTRERNQLRSARAEQIKLRLSSAQ